jgi:hypothetical protein
MGLTYLKLYALSNDSTRRHQGSKFDRCFGSGRFYCIFTYLRRHQLALRKIYFSGHFLEFLLWPKASCCLLYSKGYFAIGSPIEGFFCCFGFKVGPIELG